MKTTLSPEALATRNAIAKKLDIDPDDGEVWTQAKSYALKPTPFLEEIIGVDLLALNAYLHEVELEGLVDQVKNPGDGPGHNEERYDLPDQIRDNH